MRRLIPGILLVALVAGVAGCDDNTPTTPTTPNTPTTPGATTTETFSGTLNLNGAQTFPFTAGAGGTIAATLTAVGPDATVPIGLSIGPWSGSTCATAISNDSATQGTIVTGTVTAAAALCVRVYDAAAKVPAAQPLSFTITVVHP